MRFPSNVLRGGPLFEFHNPYELPSTNGGGSTSTSTIGNRFSVSFISSNECTTKYSLGDGGGSDDINGPCGDIPWPQFSFFLTIIIL
jgi:hypothetical protein